MNTYKPDNTFCKAKAGHWFFVLLLCFRLAFAEVPGPCRHSVTKDHLQKFKRLIENQLQNGCLINYTFTERQSLGKICYVKAALHQIQDLLQNHFKYARSSDNYRYVNELKEVIKNIFSQKCIPDIDEAHEDDPIKFQKVYHTSPKEALQKAQKVIELYMELMMENNAPVNWNCEEEFGQDYIESTIVTIRTTGPSTQCHCSCPTLGHGSSDQVSLPATSPWSGVPKPIFLQSQFPQHIPGFIPTPHVTERPDGCQYTDPGFDSSSKMKVTDSTVPIAGSKVSRDISSTTGLAIVGGTDSDPTYQPSSPFSNEENDGPSFVSHRNFQPVSVSPDPVTSEPLDENKAWNIPKTSAQVTEVFVDGIDLGSGVPSMSSLASTERLRQNGIFTFTTTEPIHESKPKSSNSVNSEQSMDESTTSIPFQEAPVGVTPDKLDENTAVMLVKRSVDPRLNRLQSILESDSQSWVASNVPLVPNVSSATDKDTEVLQNLPSDSKKVLPTPEVANEIKGTSTVIPILRKSEATVSKLSGLFIRESPDFHITTDDPSSIPKSESVSVMLKDGTVGSPGRVPHSSQHPSAKGSSSIKAVGDHGKDSKINTSELPNISYKTAFIMASVCGGLLLITALYCYKEQQKLRTLLQRHKMVDNQRNAKRT
ncbi:macrophage colony-stimulating factor 1a isoform X2 [Scleropages formosus]|uniref:Colony stimulating factor 1a (macrophage) n=1 Tax=Scleropages formosus TaxID=113540 RepID=A0A8C9QZK2_SCLFO|nr:macrophage colony-stimulating factor 1 isoform X2 [Scleropages formosus]